MEPDKMKSNGSGMIFRGPVFILLMIIALVIGLGIGIGIGFAIGDNNNTGSGNSDVGKEAGNRFNETADAKVSCDITKVDLSQFEVWRREEGYWYGEYTLLGEDGNPYVSSENWNYNYAHCYGFAHLQLIGNALKQRNVLIYPPQSNTTCFNSNNSTVGNGTCGINGSEKIFSANQNASDCDGRLSGLFTYGGFTLDSFTNIISEGTVVNSVRLPKSFGGGFTQNQLTTLPGNDIRVRTAQGFDMLGKPLYASFYREYKQASRHEWIDKMREIRRVVNILPSDECGYDSLNAPSRVTCKDHFGFTI